MPNTLMRGLILAALMFATAAGAAPVDASLAEAMTGSATPAMGAVVIRDFKAETIAVRGVRRLGGSEPVAAGDLWHLGSDGKAMTATLVARLVDRGLLSWDKPLAQMLPDLADRMRPEYRDVTLLDLMSHRSGLRDMQDDKDPFFQAFYRDARPLAAQRRSWAEHELAEAPVVEKRTKSSYSNANFIIAGLIAERAGGDTYENLMRREVFAPLGMRSPTTAFAGARDLSGHLAGHPATAHDANPGVLNPAGGWRMSLADWSRFCIDQMAGEHGRGKLLKAETYRVLHTAQGQTNAALGWGAAPRAAGRQGPALTHQGSDGTWIALVILFPASGNGALVTANAADDMGGDKAALAVARALVTDLAPPAQPAP
jgi:CubicO group peptidase (beta-lactamase class C family)